MHPGRPLLPWGGPSLTIGLAAELGSWQRQLLRRSLVRASCAAALLTLAGCDGVWRYAVSVAPDAGAVPGIDGGAAVPPGVDAPSPPRGCAEGWLGGAIELAAVEPVVELNSSAVDHEPFLSADGLTIYFDSNRAGGLGSFDVYRAVRGSPDEPFSPAENLGWVNTAEAETRFAVTDDGLTAFLSADWSGPGSLGYSDIYRATRAASAGAFSEMVLVAAINTADHHEYDPYPVGDGQRIYFSRQSADAGPSNLFVSERAVGGAYQQARAVAGLEATGDGFKDANPAVDATETVLLFSSNRPGGAGGTDIFVSTRALAAGPFSAPIPVPGINSAEVDTEVYLSPDACMVYFASNRSGAAGSYDIYRTRVLP